MSLNRNIAAVVAFSLTLGFVGNVVAAPDAGNNDLLTKDEIDAINSNLQNKDQENTHPFANATERKRYIATLKHEFKHFHLEGGRKNAYFASSGLEGVSELVSAWFMDSTNAEMIKKVAMLNLASCGANVASHLPEGIASMVSSAIPNGYFALKAFDKLNNANAIAARNAAEADTMESKKNKYLIATLICKALEIAGGMKMSSEYTEFDAIPANSVTETQRIECIQKAQVRGSALGFGIIGSLITKYFRYKAELKGIEDYSNDPAEEAPSAVEQTADADSEDIVEQDATTEEDIDDILG